MIVGRINTKADLKDWLSYELPRYGKGGLKAFIGGDECWILRHHQILLRKTEYYINSKNKVMYLIYKARLNRIQNKYTLHIPPNCCGRGLKIMHVGPILINQNAHLGEDCALHINTAIVASGLDSSVPVLEDRVVVGVGAVILGGVRIAKNVAIGANAVVNKDVSEENIAVAGVPAKKISNNGRLAWNKK
ncbi:MAG: serine O-acetyltransferase [Clostridia bacterium]